MSKQLERRTTRADATTPQDRDEVASAPRSLASDRRGRPVEIKSKRDYGDEQDALPIDFGESYRPGDVFRHVFADLPGFEHIDAPGNDKAVAEAGVRGPGEPLPHAAAIQKSFGKQDVSGIKAHVGGPAAAATDALGAQAYATGNSVAFKEQPDLHTAAHEAAHVLQQSDSVQFKGKSGTEGSASEKQADAAADAVVAGKSAEPALEGAGDPHQCEGTDGPVKTGIIDNWLQNAAANVDAAGGNLGLLSSSVELLIEVLAASEGARRAFSEKEQAIATRIKERGETSTLDTVLNTAKSAATIVSMFYGNVQGAARVAKKVSSIVTAYQSADKATKSNEGADVGVEQALFAGLAEVQNYSITLSTQLQELNELFSNKNSLDAATALRKASIELQSVAKELVKSAGCELPYSYRPEFVNSAEARIDKLAARVRRIDTQVARLVTRLQAAELVGGKKMSNQAKFRSLFDYLESQSLSGELEGVKLVLGPGSGEPLRRLQCTAKAGDQIKERFPVHKRNRVGDTESSAGFFWNFPLPSAEFDALRLLEAHGLPFEDKTNANEDKTNANEDKTNANEDKTNAK